MEKNYKILQLQHSSTNGELVEIVVRWPCTECSYSLPENEISVRNGRHNFYTNNISCEHTLYIFNSIMAFGIAKEAYPEISFLLVNGAVSKEYVVELKDKGNGNSLVMDKIIYNF